jgi:hypothetical protein
MIEPCDVTLNPLNRVAVPEKYEKRVEELEAIVRINLAKLYKQTKAAIRDNVTRTDEELADELGTDDIFTANGVSDEAWETFTIFLEILGKILKNYVEDPEINLEGFRAGIYMQKAYRASILYSNQQSKSSKGKLYNLWNRLGVKKAVPAPAEYVRMLNEYDEDEFDKFWERYVIDESYTRSIFSNTDKLKIMDTAIQTVLLINNLQYYNYVEAYFPLHNDYELEGWIRTKRPVNDEFEEDLKRAMGEEVYNTIEPEDQFVEKEWRITI